MNCKIFEVRNHIVNEPVKTEINLLDYLVLIMRYRRMILRNVIIMVVVVFLISLLLPKQYIAVTTLLPPPEQEKMSMSNLLSEVSVPGLSLPSRTTSADLFVEMLRSRSVGERVLNRRFAFKGDSLTLLKILGRKNVEKGLKAMADRAFFVLSKKGIITISVRMPSPQLAADVANAYVQELDRINREKVVSRAKNSRIYIESQLRETEAKLSEATRRLAEYQRGHRAVSLEEQTKAAIDQVAELKGKIIAKQVEIGVMRQSMKEENPLLVRAKRELAEMQDRYQALQYGDAGIESKEFYLPFDKVPEVGIQLALLLREAKVQETVWQLLNQQYYQAKIEEARDTPTVQVLDEAVPPLRKSSPRRTLLMVVFGVLSLVASVGYIFIEQYRLKLSERPEEKAQWQTISEMMKSDWQLLREKLVWKK